MGDSRRRHVFISHHHKDDSQVTKLTNLLNKAGYDVRNSSVRMKPENRERLNKGRVKDAVIKRLLRMKISWASKTIVLVGSETHTRPWVNWEITQAHEQGKDIVGVYIQGGTEADIPKALEDYGSSIVAWNTGSIIKALDGESHFQSPDGTPRPPKHSREVLEC